MGISITTKPLLSAPKFDGSNETAETFYSKPQMLWLIHTRLIKNYFDSFTGHVYKASANAKFGIKIYTYDLTKPESGYEIVFWQHYDYFDKEVLSYNRGSADLIHITGKH